VSYNYRLRLKNGTYRYLLQQFSYMMVDQDLNPLVIMGTTTDISNIYTKSELFCRLTIKNKKGIWENVFEKYRSNAESPHSFQLTEKEFEIIRFVHNGHSSKEIAQRTNRSVETINSQRKSILNKTSCKSMTEVIVMAKENHWI
jgi:DNA-binding NarL/FixJ family response regulator